jgi:hypothetical protein
LRHKSKNPDITFTKKNFAQNSQALEIRVIAQIEFIQKYATFLSIFESFIPGIQIEKENILNTFYNHLLRSV